MKILDYSAEFLDKVNDYGKLRKRVEFRKNINFFNNPQDTRLLIHGITVENVTFSGSHFDDFTFKNCRFVECQFEGGIFFNTEFNNCTFQTATLIDLNFDNSTFINTIFTDSKIKHVSFYYIDFFEIQFIQCSIHEVKIDVEEKYDMLFERSDLSYIRFQSSYLDSFSAMRVLECGLQGCSFTHLDLKKSFFKKSSISTCSFSNCIISSTTFEDCFATEDEFSYVDFQTIINSDIESIALVKIFGIHEPDIKSFVTGMVSKIELHTVFISYSFVDKELVRKINAALRMKGVFTFIWEKDAPIGLRLKDIMQKNISKFDKLLFVASVNSLKSDACHFELSEARKKQDRNWDLVYFPIHIDDFLFKVQKHDIPLKKRQEFWENVEELKDINSSDFSEFNGKSIDEVQFNNAIDKLIRGLRRKVK